jgi:dTDP-4-dehydrorhamnose 3,5-epimerase
MKITETGFDGLLIIEPIVYADSRGYFMESYNQDTFHKTGIDFKPIQDNESRSVKGVIRGLHFQLRPYDQSKLIRVIEGEIQDVALDIRRSSKTFGRWYGIKLNSENKKQLLIPRGFAHGFSVLSKTAVILYKCDSLYKPAFERGILISDPLLDIDWKTDVTKAIISDKDLKNPQFHDAENNF